MATIMHRGNEIHTTGTLPAIGSKAPGFRLVKSDLSDAHLEDFKGNVKILNIVPSLDTSICALSAKKFDAEAGKLDGVVVLNISADLPFAASRFCKAEGLSNIIALSQMRDRAFGHDYGVEIVDGLLAGVLSRAVVVVDAQDRIFYTEQVGEIGREPDYPAALAAAKEAAGIRT